VSEARQISAAVARRFLVLRHLLAPPRSGRTIVIPEVDDVAWFGPEEACRRAHPAQAAFVERLLEAIGRPAS
jgi:predicted NUDIX family NTP pyrophosphohydrolase